MTNIDVITPKEFEEMVKRSAGAYYRRIISTLLVLFVVLFSAFSGAMYVKITEARAAKAEKEVAFRKLAILPDTEGILVQVPAAVQTTVEAQPGTAVPPTTIPAPVEPVSPSPGVAAAPWIAPRVRASSPTRTRSYTTATTTASAPIIRKPSVCRSECPKPVGKGKSSPKR